MFLAKIEAASVKKVRKKSQITGKIQRGWTFWSFRYLCKHKKIGLMRDSNPRAPASQALSIGPEIRVNHWAERRAYFYLKFMTHSKYSKVDVSRRPEKLAIVRIVHFFEKHRLKP